jgi:hypothetical protein
MTCERASELITELVCGELDAAGEASVRDHAKGCPTCGPELEKFARVLRVAESIPLDEPSPKLDLRVMQAAREALSRKGGSAEAIDSDSPVSGFRAWLDRLSTWAMSPQVAMASVLLLVVGIGLYALPLRQEPSVTGMLPISQEPDEHAAAPAASAATAPTAAPSELPAAEMADKSATFAEKAESKAKPSASSSGARGRAESAPGYGYGEGGDQMAKRSAGAASNVVAERPARRNAKSDELARDDAEGSSLREIGGGVGGAAGVGVAKGGPYAPPPPYDQSARSKSAAKPAAPKPEPFAEAESASPASQPAAVMQAAPAPAELDSLASGKAAPAKELDKKSEAASEPNFGQMLDEGLSAGRTGQYARAVELLEPVANKAPAAQRASARPMLARSLRAQGLCARALPYYALLVKATGVSDATLLEAADCYERTGNAAMASELRARVHAPKK